MRQTEYKPHAVSSSIRVESSPADKDALAYQLTRLLETQIGYAAYFSLLFTLPRPGAYDAWVLQYVVTDDVVDLLHQSRVSLGAGWVAASVSTRAKVLALLASRGMVARLASIGQSISRRVLSGRIAQRSLKWASKSTGLTAVKAAYSAWRANVPSWISRVGRVARGGIATYATYASWEIVTSGREQLIEELVDEILKLTR